MLFKDSFKELMAEIREVTGFRVNDRNDSKVVAWAKKVKKAGKCNMCGSKENLVAHHIVLWEYSIKGRTDINNGMCLCKDCHKIVHNACEYTDYMRGVENE